MSAARAKRSTSRQEAEPPDDTLVAGFVGRLKEVIAPVGTPNAFAKSVPMSQSGLSRLLHGGAPTLPVLVRIARAAGVRVAWLATGEGSMTEGDVPEISPQFTQPPSASVAARLPVIGLAECGLKGWYMEGALAISIPRPTDIMDPDAFAVFAYGESMRPEGILPGFLCVCAPRATLVEGDAVFLHRNDGKASIKLLLRHDGEWFYLRGWLPPDADGHQKPYTEQLRSDQVDKIAPIISIKRKW